MGSGGVIGLRGKGGNETAAESEGSERETQGQR